MRKLFALLLLCATSAYAAQVTLSWTYVATDFAKFGITGFQVERKPALCGVGTAPFVIINTTAAVLAYVDTTVVEGNSYCYRVAARGAVNVDNPTGLSAYSGTAEKSVPLAPGPYPAPTNLIITIQAAWNSQTGTWDSTIMSMVSPP